MAQTSDNNPFLKKIAGRLESTLNDIPESEIIERLEKVSKNLNCTIKITHKTPKNTPLKIV